MHHLPPIQVLKARLAFTEAPTANNFLHDVVGRNFPSEMYMLQNSTSIPPLPLATERAAPADWQTAFLK